MISNLLSNIIKSIIRTIFIIIIFIFMTPGFLFLVPGDNNWINFAPFKITVWNALIAATLFAIVFFGTDFLLSSLIFTLF